LKEHFKNVRTLKFSQNSQILLSGGDDSSINLTDVETLQRKMTVTGHSDWITSLSVSTNTKTFVSGSLDGYLKIWDLNSGKCTKTMGMNAPVWGVAFSPSGEHLVAVSQDGNVSLISMQL
jgi:WD40 repeat protein